MLTEIVPVLLFIVSVADLVVISVTVPLKGLHPHDLLGVMGLVDDPDHDLAARSQAEDQAILGIVAVDVPVGERLAPHALLQVVGQADLAAVELALGIGKPADHHIIGRRRAATAGTRPRFFPTTGYPAHRYPPGAD